MTSAHISQLPYLLKTEGCVSAECAGEECSGPDQTTADYSWVGLSGGPVQPHCLAEGGPGLRAASQPCCITTELLPRCAVPSLSCLRGVKFLSSLDPKLGIPTGVELAPRTLHHWLILYSFFVCLFVF